MENPCRVYEVGCHSKSRRAAEVSIQPTGQEADMLFFRDRRIGFHASIYEGTIGRYEAGLPRRFWPMVFDIRDRHSRISSLSCTRSEPRHPSSSEPWNPHESGMNVQPDTKTNIRVAEISGLWLGGVFRLIIIASKRPNFFKFYPGSQINFQRGWDKP